MVADEGPRALMLNLPGMRADQAARSPAPGAPAHVAGLWRSLTSRSSQSRSCSSLSPSLFPLHSSDPGERSLSNLIVILAVTNP